MKRVIVGTAFCAPLIVAMAVIFARWPVVFWLLVLSASVYLVFGRRAAIEFRIGIGNGGCGRRLCAALVWKLRAKAANESQAVDSEFESVNMEDRV